MVELVELTDEQQAKLDLLDPGLRLEWSGRPQAAGKMFFIHMDHERYGRALCSDARAKPASVIYASTFDEAITLYVKRPPTSNWQ